jgi:hypothetical protein
MRHPHSGSAKEWLQSVNDPIFERSPMHVHSAHVVRIKKKSNGGWGAENKIVCAMMMVTASARHFTARRTSVAKRCAERGCGMTIQASCIRTLDNEMARRCSTASGGSTCMPRSPRLISIPDVGKRWETRAFNIFTGPPSPTPTHRYQFDFHSQPRVRWEGQRPAHHLLAPRALQEATDRILRHI